MPYCSDHPRRFDNHLTGVKQDVPTDERQRGLDAAGRIRPNLGEVFQHGADGQLRPVDGWHTTGPFDFSDWSHNINWRGVGEDLGDIASGAIGGLGVGQLGEQVVKGLGLKIGPSVVRGIINGHHPFPKFMGGPARQGLFRIHRSLHDDLHRDLGKAYRELGFPKISGKGGGTDIWREYFARNPMRRDEAKNLLLRVTRDFDRKNGTKIAPHVEREITKPPPGR